MGHGGRLIPALQGRAEAHGATLSHHRCFFNVFFTLLFSSGACSPRAPSPVVSSEQGLKREEEASRGQKDGSRPALGGWV